MSTKFRNLFKHLGIISSNDVDVVASERKTKELYDEAATTGKAPGKTCKIQILGDERRGKTSLRKRLMGEKFDPKEPPTFGVDTRFCKVNRIDETWRERKEEHVSEYENVISWVLANALRKHDESSTAHAMPQTKLSWIWSKLLKAVVSTLSLFALMSVVILNVALSSLMTAPTVCYSLILISSLSVFLTNKSDIYRVGVGVAIFVPLVDVLFKALIKDNLANKDINIQFATLFPLSTTLYGFICGFGLRTGVAAGTLAFVTPANDNLENPTVPYHDVIKLFLGLGCGMNAIFWCSSGQATVGTAFKYLKCIQKCRIVFAIAILLFSWLLYSSNISCFFDSKYMKVWSFYFYGIFMGVGVMAGLFLGRCLASRFAYDNSTEKFIVGFVTGIAGGHMLGYQIPFLQSSQELINMIVRQLPLVFAEIFRRLINKTNPAPIQILSNKLAKNMYSLPLKLSLWDFAGQEFYYNTHHTFMAPDAVYIIVFDLFIFKQESLRHQELGRIKFWMNSVHQHANSPIFLVGTHLDCIVEEDLNVISHYLDDYLLSCNYAFLNKLVPNKNSNFFAIDNSGTMSKSSELQDDTIFLREAIQKETEKTKVMTEEYPIRWRHFLDMIHMNCKISNPSSATYETFISLMSLKTILKDFGLSDVIEIQKMLEFFNASGEIMYDHVDSILRQYVILQPQFLVDVMESIVDIPDSKALGRFSKSANHLKNTGVLEPSLAKFLVTRRVELGNDSNLCLVLSMLEAKDLLCKVYHVAQTIHISHESKGKLLYVVPSMLPKGQPVPAVSVEWDVQYYFDFGPSLPDAVFFRLMARCSSHSNLLCQGTDQCLLFREGGLFNLGTQFFFMLRKLQPCIDQDVIEVSVKGTPESNPIDILRYLHNIMETLRCRDFPYQAGIRCPYPGPHQGCKLDWWHIIHLCGSGDTLFPEECKIHRLCNGRLVDFDLDAAIPVNCGELDEKPMIVNIMGDNNYVVIAGRNARISIHRELTSISKSRAGNCYNAEDLSDIDVFISCSSRDEGWVQENIVRSLISPPHKLTVCTNQYDTRTHQNHVINIKEIKASHVFLVVCSKTYRQDQTGRLRYEREVARRYKLPIVAVCVDCDDITPEAGPEDMFDIDVISLSSNSSCAIDLLISKVLLCLRDSEQSFSSLEDSAE